MISLIVHIKCNLVKSLPAIIRNKMQYFRIYYEFFTHKCWIENKKLQNNQELSQLTLPFSLRQTFLSGIFRAFFLSVLILLIPAGIGALSTQKTSVSEENVRFSAALEKITGSLPVSSLQNPLPQGYRVGGSDETAFLKPEELIARFMDSDSELPENWQTDEAKTTAVMMRMIALHTKALGDMYSRTKGWDAERMAAESWIEAENAEKEPDPALLSAAKAASGYFLAVPAEDGTVPSSAGNTDTILWRQSSDISVESLIKRLQNGESPGEIWREYEKSCFLEQAADSSG